MSWLNEPIALVPIHFFSLSFDAYYLSPEEIGKKSGELGKKYVLPSTSDLCGEASFAEVALAWNREGLAFQVKVEHPMTYTAYPDVANGDSVELFVDTRDIKTSGYNTRFCHRFYFLPQEVNGHQAGELTHFRGDDSHPLCDSGLLQVRVKPSSKGYSMFIIIPGSCLHGYDPEQFDRLGFTYRINRAHFFPQHFAASGVDYHIEQQPSLWASLNLVLG